MRSFGNSKAPKWPQRMGSEQGRLKICKNEILVANDVGFAQKRKGRTRNTRKKEDPAGETTQTRGTGGAVGVNKHDVK